MRKNVQRKVRVYNENKMKPRWPVNNSPRDKEIRKDQKEINNPLRRFPLEQAPQKTSSNSSASMGLETQVPKPEALKASLTLPLASWYKPADFLASA